MRCWICNFNAEEMPGTNNHVFVDPATKRETCQECYDISLEAVLEMEIDDESSDNGKPTVSEMPIV